MRTVWSIFAFCVQLFVVVAVVWGGVYYMWGESTVRAYLDGEELEGAMVEVNGQYVGTTPYTARLFGLSEVTVLLDSDGLTQESEIHYTLFSLGLGTKLPAHFNTLE